MIPTLYKYPRTHHIEGSRFQPGDEELDSVPFEAIAGRHVVVAEKVDGANAAISFSPEGKLLLQSRGHYLMGGPREKQFNLFKPWAQSLSHSLWQALGSRCILYGEWLYAKHTMFYNYLPHYFLAFEVLDREEGVFLSTERRIDLLNELPIASVDILFTGKLKTHKELFQLLGRSHYIQSGHLDQLRQVCAERNLESEHVLQETDPSTDMEGLYIKVEEDGIVKERYKYIRASFHSVVAQAGEHWSNRPILPNLLQSGVDLFRQKAQACIM
jgi:hypothetical protein